MWWRPLVAGRGRAPALALGGAGAGWLGWRAGAEAEAEESDGKGTDPGTVAGIKQYPANKPIEDRCYMERMSNGAWWFSVFDGHGGWQCSDYASKNLHLNVAKAVANHLGERFATDDDLGLYEGRIDRRVVTKALKSAFDRTDRQYMVKVFGAFELGFGRDTRAGSCALGTLVVDGVLFVANAGDSRAVLAVNRNGYEASTAQRSKSGRVIRPPTQHTAEADVTDGAAESEQVFDELMSQAALKETVGEEISPKLAEALRAKLLSQIYELKQQSGKTKTKTKGSDLDDPAQGGTAIEGPAEEDPAAEADAVSGGSRLVNALRTLTGGKGGEAGTTQGDGAAREGPSFVAIDMSHDHNCREPRERDALEKNHPGEKDVVVCRADNPDQCYIKGKLQPTRAFGDFYLKYSEFMRSAGEDAAAGRYVPPPYTPPYITATPEVQVRTLRKGVDEFLVMGSDGLWDLMSSQEAVDIAGAQLRKPGGTPAEASEVLVEECLRRAAAAHGFTVGQLRSLKEGRARRSKHDDISVVVVDLAKLVDMHYWG